MQLQPIQSPTILLAATQRGSQAEHLHGTSNALKPQGDEVFSNHHKLQRLKGV